MIQINKVAILGGGNLGGAIARGFAASGFVPPGNVAVTRRRGELLADLAAEGFRTLSDNRAAVDGADVVILSVQPLQMEELLEGVSPALDARRQVVISTATGMSIADIRRWVGSEVPVLRAMPNLGIAIGESMTCLAADEASTDAVPVARAVFDVMGSTLLIREDQMTSATALCACGIAFFLRAIRAASQGGIEIGFHADEALQLASQTAKGPPRCCSRTGITRRWRSTRSPRRRGAPSPASTRWRIAASARRCPGDHPVRRQGWGALPGGGVGRRSEPLLVTVEPRLGSERPSPFDQLSIPGHELALRRLRDGGVESVSRAKVVSSPQLDGSSKHRPVH